MINATWAQRRPMGISVPEPSFDYSGAGLEGLDPSSLMPANIAQAPDWKGLLMGLGSMGGQQARPQGQMAPAFRSSFQMFNPAQFMRAGIAAPQVRGLLG
jgi:hypothetical protein